MKDESLCLSAQIGQYPSYDTAGENYEQAIIEYREKLEQYRLDGVSEAFVCARIGCTALYGNHRDFNRIEPVGKCANTSGKAAQHEPPKQGTHYIKEYFGKLTPSDLTVAFSDVGNESMAERLAARVEKTN